MTRRHPLLDRILREEREFIHGLGGYSFGIAGGTLVVNERVPVPRFNFVTDVAVSRHRMTGFFETVLDHYFQRALRPEFLLPEPPPGHLVEVLGRLGFLPRTENRSVLLCDRTVPAAPVPPTHSVRRAAPEEIGTIVDFLVSARERAELARGLEVLWAHPNPEEEMIPVLAWDADRPVAAALLHRFRGIWGVHSVATQPESRGRGAASRLIYGSLHEILPEGPEPVAAWADHPRVRGRLERLGFHEVGRFRVFVLDPQAELAVARGPTGPVVPRWRPPRSPSSTTAASRASP